MCFFLLIQQKRNEIVKDVNKEIVTTAIVEGNTVMRSRKQLGQIIDTTLLKCYIQVEIYIEGKRGRVEKFIFKMSFKYEIKISSSSF